MSDFAEMLSNLAASCELDKSKIGLFYDVFHGGVGAIDEIYILSRHATRVTEEQELLHDNWHAIIAF